jgi:hypothetical protein
VTGCFVRLGCLAALILALIAGWLTKDRWLPRVTGRHAAVVAPAPGWEPVSDPAAERMRVAFDKLYSTRGPVFVTVTPAEVASYVFRTLIKNPKARVDSVSARGVGDRISVRANIQLSALKDVSSLGPIAALLGDRQNVELTGTLHVLKRGLAELKVYELKVGDLAVPHALIPRVIRQLYPEPKPAGLAEDAVPFAIPNDLGDIRVANGKIILYKTTTK